MKTIELKHFQDFYGNFDEVILPGGSVTIIDLKDPTWPVELVEERFQGIVFDDSEGYKKVEWLAECKSFDQLKRVMKKHGYIVTKEHKKAMIVYQGRAGRK